MGTYGLQDISLLLLNTVEPAFSDNLTLDPDAISSFEIVITENGGLGGYWAGEFNGSGTWRDRDNNNTTNTYPFSGEFRVPIQ